MTLQTQWNAVYPDRPLTPADSAEQFRQRVIMAAVITAINVGTEAVNTPNHTNRTALAKAVSTNPIGFMEPFALMLAAENLDNASTDVQITNMLAAVWNTMAGAL